MNFREELAAFVNDNPKLVTMKPIGIDSLYILKYTRKVFYNNLFNQYLERCRGTIVDAEFNLITNPFTKIYNFGIEENAPTILPDERVMAIRKVNGFMVSLSWFGDIIVSTTGSTSSEYVKMAKEMMLEHRPWSVWQELLYEGRLNTFMFECVHPNDPHIIPEIAGMYFLGGRKNEWDADVEGFRYGMEWHKMAKLGFNCHAPETYVTTMENVQRMVKDCHHEGFVVYTEDGRCTKIKSPYYLTKKLFARCPNAEKLVNRSMRQRVPEEFYGLLDLIQSMPDKFLAMPEQDRLRWIRQQLGDV